MNHHNPDLYYNHPNFQIEWLDYLEIISLHLMVNLVLVET